MVNSISFRAIACVVVFAGILLFPVSAIAQEAVPEEKLELANLLAEARQYEIRTTKPDVLLTLREPPVLNFTNPERNQERGSVLVWMQNDRPVVIGQFFCFGVMGTRKTKHALHSLWHEPLVARVDDKIAWSPEQKGIDWKTFADAPDVAANHTSRMLQMRQLARRFKVTLVDPKDKATELRLAPKPLFEYSAAKGGVTDGAIFSYVIATDPEAVLLIEAFEESKKSGFRYAFARFHFYKLTATDGDREVWSVPADLSMMRNARGNPESIKKVYNSFHP